MRGEEPPRTPSSVSSDEEWPMPATWRTQHGTAHTRRLGGDAARPDHPRLLLTGRDCRSPSRSRPAGATRATPGGSRPGVAGHPRRSWRSSEYCGALAYSPRLQSAKCRAPLSVAGLSRFSRIGRQSGRRKRAPAKVLRVIQPRTALHPSRAARLGGRGSSGFGTPYTFGSHNMSFECRDDRRSVDEWRGYAGSHSYHGYSGAPGVVRLATSAPSRPLC